LKAEDLTFIDEPPGTISSISIDYDNKGTIEFYLERTSVILDNLNNKEHYLKKVADKIIDEIEWKSLDGKKGSFKSIIIY
jgi:hypothetical protein